MGQLWVRLNQVIQPRRQSRGASIDLHRIDRDFGLFNFAEYGETKGFRPACPLLGVHLSGQVVVSLLAKPGLFSPWWHLPHDIYQHGRDQETTLHGTTSVGIARCKK